MSSRCEASRSQYSERRTVAQNPHTRGHSSIPRLLSLAVVMRCSAESRPAFTARRREPLCGGIFLTTGRIKTHASVHHQPGSVQSRMEQPEYRAIRNEDGQLVCAIRTADGAQIPLDDKQLGAWIEGQPPESWAEYVVPAD